MVLLHRLSCRDRRLFGITEPRYLLSAVLVGRCSLDTTSLVANDHEAVIPRTHHDNQVRRRPTCRRSLAGAENGERAWAWVLIRFSIAKRMFVWAVAACASAHSRRFRGQGCDPTTLCFVAESISTRTQRLSFGGLFASTLIRRVAQAEQR